MPDNFRTMAHLPGYLFCASGDVVSLRRTVPVYLLGGRDKDGYVTHTLAINAVGQPRRVKKYRRAHLICEAFHGLRPEELMVRHLDGNPSNDAEDNLRWGTGVENSADSFLHGTKPIGEKVKTATTTEQQARMIKTLFGTMPRKDIAKQVGVSLRVVDHINYGESWKWLKV